MPNTHINQTVNEFLRLKNICYLDHIGAGLYADSQIEAIFADLKSTLYGNPHSASSISTYCKDAIDQIRYRILEHFGTNTEEYDVVFTSGATQSLKIVVESFDWSKLNDYSQSACESVVDNHGHFVYARDNHTSVLGLREIIDEKNVDIHCLEHEEAFRIFTSDVLPSKKITGNNSLFVYSAQCNFSGCKYPLSWIRKVHDGFLDEFVGTGCSSKWFCLLDAASYVPTSELNLSQYPADFIALSFYKIFGYPTGLGALLVRKSSSFALKKRYYGGGTILIALSDELFHRKRENISDAFEDGTVDYLAILSLRHGFDALQRLGGNMPSISTKVFSLAQYLHDKLLMLHHSNGNPAVKLYRDTDYRDNQTQGGVVNFNLLRCDKQYIGYMEVQQIANLFGIQLRTGCFCNPGACQRHLNLTNDQLKKNFQKGHTCADNIDLIDGYPTGSVRVSFGYSSSQADVDKLIDTITECFVSKPVVFKTPVTWAADAQKLKAKFEYFNQLDLKRTPEEVMVIGPKTVDRTPELRHVLDAKLTKIFVYPIKSCAPFDVVGSWPMTNTGLKYDREWMIVSSDGVALTQKQAPQMCLIKPYICLTRQTMTLEFGDPNKCTLPGITIHTHAVVDTNSDIGRFCQSKVCGDQVTVADWGDSVAEWLQSVLQLPGLRLVRITKRHLVKADVTLSLSNQAQYLLITEASVKWLWKRTSQSVVPDSDNMLRRFRSNFVIGGNIEELEELTWKRVYIGNLQFEVKSACSRCSMICINPSTGEKNREPLTALASALNGKIKFGIYLNQAEIEPWSVKVHDDISVEYSSL